jgi:hypothetical protein
LHLSLSKGESRNTSAKVDCRFYPHPCLFTFLGAPISMPKRCSQFITPATPAQVRFDAHMQIKGSRPAAAQDLHLTYAAAISKALCVFHTQRAEVTVIHPHCLSFLYFRKGKKVSNAISDCDISSSEWGRSRKAY